jgi:hypothetical protein
MTLAMDFVDNNILGQLLLQPGILLLKIKSYVKSIPKSIYVLLEGRNNVETNSINSERRT